MSEALIHEAYSATDIDAVRALFRAYGDHLATTAAICIENLDGEIASLPVPYLALLLATVNGQPAGCVALKSLARDGERASEVKRLWVDPAFRGHHLGEQLMKSAIAHALRLGHTALYLDTVLAAMPAANRLYQAMGFERIERYNSNPVPDIAFFRLPLTMGGGESR